MAKELVIKYRDSVPHNIPTQCFDFFDIEGNLIPLDKLFGRTTTWPKWYYGVTRVIDGHTWWLVQVVSMNTQSGLSHYDLTHIDENNKIIGIVHCFPYPGIDKLSTVEQRAMIRMTEEEAQAMKNSRYPSLNYALGIRDDSLAWDIFYGTKKDGRLPIGLPVKVLDDRIDWWNNVYLPQKKKQDLINEQRIEREALQLYDISDLSVPSLKSVVRGRGRSTRGGMVSNEINVVKTINGLNHNQKAILKRMGLK